MKFKALYIGSREITIQLMTDGYFYTEKTYDIYIEDKYYASTNKVVSSIYHLEPEKDYRIGISEQGKQPIEYQKITTKYEDISLDVRQFGAKGDGISEDTISIQAAIMSCPKDGRITIPKGIYKVSALFLKSDICIELEEGAVLSGIIDREKKPILPGKVKTSDPNSEYALSTWEGEAMDCFAALLNGIHVKNVTITGFGKIDGCASYENWWSDEWKKSHRPRLVYFNRCSNIIMQGITVMNSPSWTIHPYLCSKCKFLDLSIYNPKVSPNTDGLNPESSNNIEIVGVKFSVGDDCIAIKSGKKSNVVVATSHIRISHCFMENGHGAVTIGSENAGGVFDVKVLNSEFHKTDRGLRIKTRRGRGKKAIVDGIFFNKIKMDNVLSPITGNMFYFCDFDGHSDYVQNRSALPVDDGTPEIGTLEFKNIVCKDSHVSGIYFVGLPEKKIKKIVLKNVTISFHENAVTGLPIMADYIMETSKCGVHIENVKEVQLENVKIREYEGEQYSFIHVDRILN